jgi:hypothetical protein
MPDSIAEQKASQEWAEAAFAKPELRARFEKMVRDTAEREPVRDDFAWLAPQQEASADEYSHFESLARKLVNVPKSAIDALRSKPN